MAVHTISPTDLYLCPTDLLMFARRQQGPPQLTLSVAQGYARCPSLSVRAPWLFISFPFLPYIPRCQGLSVILNMFFYISLLPEPRGHTKQSTANKDSVPSLLKRRWSIIVGGLLGRSPREQDKTKMRMRMSKRRHRVKQKSVLCSTQRSWRNIGHQDLSPQAQKHGEARQQNSI